MAKESPAHICNIVVTAAHCMLEKTATPRSIQKLK
jgi:hypothetical protein